MIKQFLVLISISVAANYFVYSADIRMIVNDLVCVPELFHVINNLTHVTGKLQFLSDKRTRENKNSIYGISKDNRKGLEGTKVHQLCQMKLSK